MTETERCQWALLQVRVALGLHRDSQDDLVVVAQRLQRSHDRYEHLRKLNPRQFADLYRANLRGEGAFDDLVDRRIEIEKANNEANGIRGGPIK